MEPPASQRPKQGCKYHPPLSAKAHCKSCGVPLCNLCIKFINGRVLCEKCVAIGPAANVDPAAQSGRLIASNADPMAQSGRLAVPRIDPMAQSGRLAAPRIDPMAQSGRTPAPRIDPMAQSSRMPAPKIDPMAQSARFNPAKPLPPEAYAQDDLIPLNRSMEDTVLESFQGTPEQLMRRREDPNSARPLNCKKHPTLPAEKKCELCGGVFCAECVQPVRKKQLCKDCARPGRTSVAIPRPPIEHKRSFFERLPEAFVYPLIQDQKFLLFGGALLMWLGFIVHWAAGLAVCSANAIWLMKIVRVTAVGREDDSTHPAFDDAFREIARPFGFFIMAVLSALAPAIAYIPLGNPDLRSYLIDQAAAVVKGEDPAAAQTQRSTDAAPKPAKTLSGCVERDGTLQILLGFAIFIFPMALGMISIFPSIDAVGPPTLIHAVFRFIPYYLLTLLLLALGIVPGWYLIGLSESFSSPIGLMASVLIHYFSIAGFHVFGNIYAADKDAFAWVALPVAQA